MSNLKTLKDVEKIARYPDKPKRVGYLFSDDLRGVAREWIDIWENRKKEHKEKMIKTKYISASDIDYISVDFYTQVALDDYVVAWIKHFFNLEESK